MKTLKTLLSSLSLMWPLQYSSVYSVCLIENNVK